MENKLLSDTSATIAEPAAHMCGRAGKDSPVPFVLSHRDEKSSGLRSRGLLRCGAHLKLWSVPHLWLWLACQHVPRDCGCVWLNERELKGLLHF